MSSPMYVFVLVIYSLLQQKDRQIQGEWIFRIVRDTVKGIS